MGSSVSANSGGLGRLHFFDCLSFDLQFSAAQFLRRKIQNEASNLQSTAKDALLNALLLAVKRYSSGVPRLLTQICLALSALLLHADPYSKPFDKLMLALQNLQPHDDGNVVMLELLSTHCSS